MFPLEPDTVIVIAVVPELKLNAPLNPEIDNASFGNPPRDYSNFVIWF